jgi:deoxyadenosine/deoxycytidine kinase
MKYHYIAIEGNIGAGKTTVAGMLAKEFSARLILERFADNSFLPKFYKDPKRYAFPLEMSFLADRYQQVKDQLINRDLFNDMIVADYIIDKSRIFANVNLKSDELLLFNRLFDIIYPSVYKPDLIIYLHLSPREVLESIYERGRPYEQEIPEDYLEKVQNRYFDYLKKQSGLRTVILEISKRDFQHNPSDFQALLKLIQKEYPYGVTTISEF